MPSKALGFKEGLSKGYVIFFLIWQRLGGSGWGNIRVIPPSQERRREEGRGGGALWAGDLEEGSIWDVNK